MARMSAARASCTAPGAELCGQLLEHRLHFTGGQIFQLDRAERFNRVLRVGLGILLSLR